jgi:hypothetical protein
MKNISKLIVGILFSALVMSPSFAGEMTVPGGATATFTMNGDDDSQGRNIGISNELDFSASGELDNGYTWSYQVQLDNATANNDDTKLVIGMGDLGTVGIFNTEGGLSQELHGVGALGAGYDYVSPSAFKAGMDVSDYSNIQYHSPSGLLPLGAQVKVGFVPNMSATTQISAKESAAEGSQATGRNMEQIALTMAPIDGLSLQADAVRTKNETGAAASVEPGVGANVGAKYTMGAITVGYVEGGYQAAIASGELAYYENTHWALQYDVNDAVSVSYNMDKSEKNQRVAVAVGATVGTKTLTEMEQESWQIAYTTGGATIGIATADVTNADYTSGKDERQTVVSLGISF